jgi:hypothetical protein
VEPAHPQPIRSYKSHAPARLVAKAVWSLRIHNRMATRAPSSQELAVAKAVWSLCIHNLAIIQTSKWGWEWSSPRGRASARPRVAKAVWSLCIHNTTGPRGAARRTTGSKGSVEPVHPQHGLRLHLLDLEVAKGSVEPVHPQREVLVGVLRGPPRSKGSVEPVHPQRAYSSTTQRTRGRVTTPLPLRACVVQPLAVGSSSEALSPSRPACRVSTP